MGPVPGFVNRAEPTTCLSSSERNSWTDEITSVGVAY